MDEQLQTFKIYLKTYMDEQLQTFKLKTYMDEQLQTFDIRTFGVVNFFYDVRPDILKKNKKSFTKIFFQNFSP